MELGFESRVVQNEALGAVAVWQFSRAYFDTTKQIHGPELPLVLLVLPMVFHARTTRAIHRMHAGSGLGKAMLDAPEIPAGLQRRVEGYANLSLAAIDLGVAAGLLDIDPDTPWPRYTPGPKTMPSGGVGMSEDVVAILGAAKRLGWWFANDNLIAVCSILNVRF